MPPNIVPVSGVQNVKLHEVLSNASQQTLRGALTRLHSTANSAPSSSFEQPSYVQGACTTSLLGSTVARNLADSAHKFPDSLAVCSVHQKVYVQIVRRCMLFQACMYCNYQRFTALLYVVIRVLQACLTYTELHSAAKQVARGLLGIGIRPGEGFRYCNLI